MSWHLCNINNTLTSLKATFVRIKNPFLCLENSANDSKVNSRRKHKRYN